MDRHDSGDRILRAMRISRTRGKDNHSMRTDIRNNQIAPIVEPYHQVSLCIKNDNIIENRCQVLNYNNR